jgi:hypothetical protein
MLGFFSDPGKPEHNAGVLTITSSCSARLRRPKNEDVVSAIRLSDKRKNCGYPTLMGFYAMLAFNANTVDLGLPHATTEPPLPV